MRSEFVKGPHRVQVISWWFWDDPENDQAHLHDMIRRTLEIR